MSDDMVIYYHRDCGWVDEAQPIYGTVNECSGCGARHCLNFVTYRSDREWEARAARSLIARDVGGAFCEAVLATRAATLAEAAE